MESVFKLSSRVPLETITRPKAEVGYDENESSDRNKKRRWSLAARIGMNPRQSS